MGQPPVAPSLMMSVLGTYSLVSVLQHETETTSYKIAPCALNELVLSFTGLALAGGRHGYGTLVPDQARIQEDKEQFSERNRIIL